MVKRIVELDFALAEDSPAAYPVHCNREHRRTMLSLCCNGWRRGIRDEDELKQFVAKEWNARHDKGLDPATIVMLIEIIMALLKWWRDRKAERSGILEAIEG